MDKSVMDGTIRTISHAAQRSDTAILFFSATGKDSIVLLDLLSKRFKRVVCVFLYHVEGLSFIEPFFAWARSYGNVEIVQLPHPDVYEFKSNGIFCHPVEGIRKIKLRDIEEYLKPKFGTDVVVYGMKIADSFNRRGIFDKAAKSEIHSDFDKYYPIVNWKNADCLSYIKLHSLPRPLKLGSTRGSSGVSFRKEVILHIKEHYPRDYQKIINEFNLLGARYGT
jgi:sulfate adenylyltransferase subunit 2